MDRRIFASMLTILSLIAVVGGSALAIFRDFEHIRGNTLSAGTVDIELTDGTAQFPNPIVAEGLLPGEFSNWSRVLVTNNSSSDVKLYFYVTDLHGAACTDTKLEVATGLTNVNEHEFSVFNSNINNIHGIYNKVELTGYVFDPDMPVNEVAAVQMRAGLDANAGNNSMNGSCNWTAVFVAEPSTEVDVEPPTSYPVSSPEDHEDKKDRD